MFTQLAMTLAFVSTFASTNSIETKNGPDAQFPVNQIQPHELYNGQNLIWGKRLADEENRPIIQLVRNASNISDQCHKQCRLLAEELIRKCVTDKFSKRDRKISSDQVYDECLNEAQNTGCIFLCIQRNTKHLTTPNSDNSDNGANNCQAQTISRSQSDHSWVRFNLPAGQADQTIRIPGGAYNKYVFPKCNRVHWNDHTYQCRAGSWIHTGGQAGADALCHGGPPNSPYVQVGDR
ncbi:MAG: hypothetical protein ABJO09_09585 [Hyphomicrobiales bacterium]